MGDERGPWIGSSWMVAVAAGDARSPRRRAVLTWVLGGALLLGALGGAGAHPVSAALPLPPVDTSEVGATGRVPDAGVAPLPEAPPAAPLPAEPSPSTGGSGSDVPETMLAAYRNSQADMAVAAPGCHLSWALVAGIGKVESDHAYGGAVAPDGTTERPILGPQLDGAGGNAAITDTDGGALDHDPVWDRAVGPTQFIPSSWRTYGADGNGDGVADPDNAFDAALATGRYLCAGGTDLATASGRHDAVFRYNHSESYVATVLRWADAYASGALPVPDTAGGIPDPVLASGSGSPTLAALPGPFPTTGARPAPSGSGLLAGGPLPAVPSTPGVPAPSSAPLTASGLVPGAPRDLVPPSSGVVSSGVVPSGVVPSGVLPSLPGLVPGAPSGVVPPSSGVVPPPVGVPSSTPTGSSSAGPTSPTPTGSSSIAPTSPFAVVPPAAPKPPAPPSPASPPPSSTPPKATPPSSTPPSSTPPSSTPPSSTPPSSTPPSSTPPSSTPPSSTPPSSTTTTSKAATIPVATLCTAEPAAVATAFGVPAADLTAATTA
uniref:lytic transglycosylase domain-containing protein n=1 Tax=Actinomycetospora chiangmaiensis TaxID=402650 RepID=UPI00036545E9